jgi:CAAX prenyl protease-like protein
LADALPVMIFLREKFKASPAYARVAPFVIFLALTFCQGQFGEESRYWFYLAKTLAGGWLIWEMRPFVSEMRWAVSWEAVVVGVAVCVMWVGIDGCYPKFGKPGDLWNPHKQFGENSALAWMFIAARTLGSAIIVPPLEEVFYRSFLYRYFVRINFQEMPLSRFHPTSFIVTSIIFGFEHYQWLAGILCGFAYQWLAIRKNRLGDAMTAHGITNFLLGVWVVWKSDWQFW